MNDEQQNLNLARAAALALALLLAACAEANPGAVVDEAGASRSDGVPLGYLAADAGGLVDHERWFDDVAPVGPFRVVMLPDTQYSVFTAGNLNQFKAQTAWIAQHRVQQNLVFVSHVGDVVQSGAMLWKKNQAEWKRADEAMQTLDGDLSAQPDGRIPYSAVAGNHDYDVVYLKGSGASQYLKYFGPSRFTGRSWFLGASADGMNKAQLFTVAGQPHLHLGLEWRASDAAILWAQGVLDAHPTLPAIVSTHEYLRTGDPAPRSRKGETPGGSGDNSGEDIYRKLVAPYPQVFMVLSGHIHGDGQRRSKTPLGREVIEVLADYQQDPNGGNGWMQLITLDPHKKRVSFKVTSPTYKAGATKGKDRGQSAESNHLFAFDLWGHRAALAGRTVRRFREGQDTGAGVYAGTRDTFIGSGGWGQTRADSINGDEDRVKIDGDGGKEQGLLRFDGLVGSAKGQIPPETKIRRAILTLTTEGSSAHSKHGGRLHRMTTAWSEQSTWASLGGGVQVGVESRAQHDVDTAGSVDLRGTRSFDVTAAVQAWVDGEPNQGWVLVANGSDGWQIRSSEWEAVVERPMLTVIY
jgi:hypothetical protein